MSGLAEGTVTLPMIHAWELDPAFQPRRRLAAGEPLGARAETALYQRLAARSWAATPPGLASRASSPASDPLDPVPF